MEGLGSSWRICCWRSVKVGQAGICEKWPWQGGSHCGQRNSLLDFLRPLPALESASCPDMNLHPLLLPPSCMCPTVWPQPRLTHPFVGTCLPASSRLLHFLILLFLLSLPPLPFSLSFSQHFPSSHSLQSSILPWTWHLALPLSADRSAKGWRMSPFMVRHSPRRWMRNLHSQVSALLLQTVCPFTAAVVTFGWDFIAP